jgi:hypothetical protein
MYIITFSTSIEKANAKVIYATLPETVPEGI